MYLFLFGTFIIGYIIYKYIETYLSPLNKIPEPKRYFLLRHFPYFAKAKDSISLMAGWANEFKEFGMYKIDILIGTNGPLIVLLKSEYIKTVLSKPDVFVRSRFLRDYLPITGNGLLTAKGDDHRNQRKFFAKSFSMSQMKYYIPVFNKHAIKLVEIWDALVKDEKNGLVLTAKDYICNMTLDAIGEISFGYNFNSQESKNNFAAEGFKALCSGVIDTKSRFILSFFPFMWYMPFGPVRALKKYSKIFNDVIDKVISTRTKKIADGTLTETEENDLLNTMILERDRGNFPDQLIRDSAFTFLFAGQETTATGLPGVLLYLSKYPDLQEKVRDEINECIHDVNSINLEDLQKLTYTDAFIKESLRLFGPIPQIARISKVAYKFGDVTLPKGSTLMSPNIIIHEGEEDFEKGQEFIPERFLASSSLKHATPFTFGYGPYNCIGKHFALLEMKVTILHILKNFQISMDPGHEKYDRKTRGTLSVTPNLRFRVSKLTQ